MSNSGPRLSIGGPSRIAQIAEKGIEAAPAFGACGQPVPCKEQIGIGSTERAPFCAQQVQRQSRIQLGIIDLAAHQSTVPVVLYQVVVGIGGKGKRTEPQRIDSRHAQHPESGRGSAQVFEIETDQVVANEALATHCELIQLPQGGVQAGAAQLPVPEGERRAGLLIDGGQRMNASATLSDFEINGNAVHRLPDCLRCEKCYIKETLRQLVEARLRNRLGALSVGDSDQRASGRFRPCFPLMFLWKNACTCSNQRVLGSP